MMTYRRKLDFSSDTVRQGTLEHTMVEAMRVQGVYFPSVEVDVGLWVQAEAVQ